MRFRRASGTGRSASPVIGTEFGSASVLRISVIGVSAIAWGCSSHFRDPLPLPRLEWSHRLRQLDSPLVECGPQPAARRSQSQAVTFTVDDARPVSGLLQVPPGARICYVVAHVAGAGMSHPFMAAVADGLAERGIATMRYQFPYMEQGSRRLDAPKLAQASVRAAVAKAWKQDAAPCNGARISAEPM